VSAARPMALVLIGLLVLLTGCWDIREMNQLALVVAVGIDKLPESGRYEVTIQVARPGGSGGGKARGGGAGDAAGGSPIYVAAADGDTLFGAIRNLAQFTSRRIMWAHNNVVVIGESVARDDITPVMDFFTRNQELRMRTWVVVARGSTAKSVVAAQTGIEQVPADSISALFRYAQLPGESVKTDINDVVAAFFGPDVNPVIAAIKLNKRALRSSEEPAAQKRVPQVELAGTAILHDQHVVGYVQRETGRGLLWLRMQMRNAVLTIPCPPGRKGNMAAEIRSPSVRVRTRIQRGVPAFDVRVETEAWLSEQDCITPEITADQLKRFAEQEMTRKIQAEIRQTLDLLQKEFKVDAINFGRQVHIQQPAWWRVNRNRWDEIFPTVPVQVTVQAHIPKMGLYVRPMNMNVH
jgi:spore germination protein KC